MKKLLFIAGLIMTVSAQADTAQTTTTTPYVGYPPVVYTYPARVPPRTVIQCNWQDMGGSGRMGFVGVISVNGVVHTEFFGDNFCK